MRSILSLVFLLTLIRAGGQGIGDTILLEPVTISGTEPSSKGFAASFFIDSLDHQLHTTGSISGLLSAQAGLFIKDYGPGSSSSIGYRGSKAGDLMIVWNGINLNSPMLGQGDLSLYPALFTDFIRITPASVPDATLPPGNGGVLETGSNPPPGGLRFSLSQLAGSYGTYATTLDISTTSGRISTRTGIFDHHSRNDYQYTNDFIYPTEDQRRKNASFFVKGLKQDIFWMLGKYNEMRMHLWIQENRRDLPEPLPSLSGQNVQKQEDQAVRGIVTHSYSKGMHRLKSHVSINHQNLAYSSEPSGIDSRNTSNEWIGTIKYSALPIPQLESNAVISAGYTEVSTSNYQDNKRRMHYGLSADLHYKGLRDHWFMLNLRQDFVDGDAMPLHFRLGVEKHLSAHHTRVFIMGGRSYRYPSMNDLYWQPGGNPELNAERAVNIESGMEFRLTSGHIRIESLQLSLWARNTRDQIVWKPNGALWSPFNVNHVVASGVDISNHIALHLSPVKITLQGAYNYINAFVIGNSQGRDNTTGKQLIYTPKHSGGQHVSVEAGRYEAGISWIYTGKRYILADHSSWLPSWHTVDIHLAASFKAWNNAHIRMLFRVKNITDTRYQSIAWYPMPGRSAEFSVRLTYKTSRKHVDQKEK